MEKDVSWKVYFRDEERFADVINGLGCCGRQVVSGEDLREVDTQTILGRLSGRKIRVGRGRRNRDVPVKIRDMVRKVAFGVNFAIVGIETQELVDYVMPLRCMIYDAGEYDKQVGRIRRALRKQAIQNRTRSRAEYLCGFAKDSRLCPVVTFVLYGGKEEWDGPIMLHEMLDFMNLPKELQGLVQNYSIILVDIRRLKDTDIFKTDVKQVFDFIRCAEDKKELFRLVKSDERFRCMEEDAYEVATNYAGAEELIKVKDEYRGKEGKIDMCKALKELIEDGRVEGRTEGRAEGIRSVVIRMIQNGKGDEEIMELTGCSVEMLWETKQSMKK